MLCACFLLLTISLGSSTDSDIMSVDPVSLLQSVRANGPDHVVGSLVENEREWSAVINGVASGESRWLAVAEALYPAADAGLGEELNQALGEALVVNPKEVLAIESLKWRLVCNLPGPDMGDYDTFDAAKDQLERMRLAVGGVSHPELAERRAEVLGVLQEEMQWFRERFNLLCPERRVDGQKVRKATGNELPTDALNLDNGIVTVSAGPHFDQHTSENTLEGRFYRVIVRLVARQDGAWKSQLIAQEMHYSGKSGHHMRVIRSWELETDELGFQHFVGWNSPRSFVIRALEDSLIVTLTDDTQFTIVKADNQNAE